MNRSWKRRITELRITKTHNFENKTSDISLWFAYLNHFINVPDACSSFGEQAIDRLTRDSLIHQKVWKNL